MSTEDKKEVVATEDSTLKKMKILAKKELKRAKDKGKKLLKEHGAKAAMALTIGGASLNVNEAQAQTYQRPSNAVEMNAADGVQYLRQQAAAAANNGGAVRQSGGTASFQGTRGAQVPMVTRVNIYGERITVPAQIKGKKGIMVYSAAYSYGLKPEYVAAYVYPDQGGRAFDRGVYYAEETLDGRLEITLSHNQEHVNEGGGPYAIPLKERKARLQHGARYGGGYATGEVYDDWDNALDQVNHTLDQVEYGIATAGRVGQMLGDVLHIGNKTGKYIQHEIKKGKGEFKKGKRTSKYMTLAQVRAQNRKKQAGN